MTAVRGDHDRAQALYVQALAADPTDANILGNYAYFMTAVRGDHDRAHELFERALAADPTDANILGNYANFMTAVRGDHDWAHELFGRALAADPFRASHLGNYARLLFILGRDVEGENRAVDALRLAGSNPNLMAMRAECRFYLFAHVAARRVESGIELQQLLARGVSTGDWSFEGNVGRVRDAGDDRAALLTALAAALRVGDPAGLDRFQEWRDLPLGD